MQVASVPGCHASEDKPHAPCPDRLTGCGGMELWRPLQMPACADCATPEHPTLSIVRSRVVHQSSIAEKDT